MVDGDGVVDGVADGVVSTQVGEVVVNSVIDDGIGRLSCGAPAVGVFVEAPGPDAGATIGSAAEDCVVPGGPLAAGGGDVGFSRGVSTMSAVVVAPGAGPGAAFGNVVSAI